MTEDQKTKVNTMFEGGRKLGKILQNLLEFSVPGISLDQIEDRAQALIMETGGTPSFTTVSGYKWATCLCVNDEVVHGIPKNYILADGDVLTIDIGMVYGGFHTDTAYTKIIGSTNTRADTVTFLSVGEQTLGKAINAATTSNRIGHISQAIEQSIKESGYSIVKSLVGHTIGKKLHEAPQIPGYVSGSIELSPKLREGMTIAIEVIYAKGKGSVGIDEDGWTIRTVDGSLSAVFEHTIAITANGPIVLTQREN